MVEHQSVLESNTCTRCIQKQNVRSLLWQALIALIDAISLARAIMREELQIRYNSNIQNIKSGFYLNSDFHDDFQASTLVSCLPSSSLFYIHLHEKLQHTHTCRNTTK